MSETREVDYLKEDPPLSGQDWAVISLIAPEDMVSKKNLYYTNHFMVNDINKTITAQAIQMVKYLSVKFRNNLSSVMDRLQNSLDDDDKRLHELLQKACKDIEVDEDEFVGECRRKYELDEEEITDRYKIFIAENRQQLDREFDDAHEHVPSTRGIKVRGSYQRFEEAKTRAKYLTESVEPAIHAFVAPVGKWLPVDFETDEAQDQEYQLPQLNDLMKKYHDNIHAKQMHYQERKQAMEESARSDNKQSIKQRLQEKLRQRRNQKMKAELEAIQSSQSQSTHDPDTLIEKSSKSKKDKKHKKHKKRVVH